MVLLSFSVFIVLVVCFQLRSVNCGVESRLRCELKLPTPTRPNLTQLLSQASKHHVVCAQ